MLYQRFYYLYIFFFRYSTLFYLVFCDVEFAQHEICFLKKHPGIYFDIVEKQIYRTHSFNFSLKKIAILVFIMYIVSKLIQILVLLLPFSSELIDIGLNQ